MTRLANHVEVYPYVMSAFRRSSREPQSAPAMASTESHAFDLNIEKVFEHWPVPFALREFIANAVDEQTITGTVDPAISIDAEGRWHIRDFGRGLSYEHLTQKENREKRKHPAVIGQFGIGLKDALARPTSQSPSAQEIHLWDVRGAGSLCQVPPPTRTLNTHAVR